jgi:Nucleotide modification associated domain 5
MKLTNYIRQAYVNSVMNDVPDTDFKEQATKIVMAAAIASLPPAVAKIYNDTKTRHYVNTTWNHFVFVSVTYPSGGDRPILSAKDNTRINELYAQHQSQYATVSILRDKVKAAAYSCTTRKALVELLPEFEKYLPSEQEAASKNLPAIANLMVDLVKAGWPKDGRKKPSIKPKPAAVPQAVISL